MFDLISYWFIYSVVTISGMFWSHTDRQKCQDVDGWFNYSQICINNTVYFNNNNRSYATSKTLLKYLKTWTSHYLSIIYFAITFYMYIFFLELDWEKKGKWKGCAPFINFANEPGFICFICFFCFAWIHVKRFYTEVK